MMAIGQARFADDGRPDVRGPGRRDICAGIRTGAWDSIQMARKSLMMEEEILDPRGIGSRRFPRGQVARGPRAPNSTFPAVRLVQDGPRRHPMPGRASWSLQTSSSGADERRPAPGPRSTRGPPAGRLLRRAGPQTRSPIPAGCGLMSYMSLVARLSIREGPDGRPASRERTGGPPSVGLPAT